MVRSGGGGCRCSDMAASYSGKRKKSQRDDIVTTLHPKGSTNDVQIESVKRELIRPDINFGRAAINTIIPIVVSLCICAISNWWALILLSIYICIRRKAILIWFIRVYQRYASEEVRLACVFEPSCSEYMILCLQRYGMIRGAFRGIKRLKRCHLPNGGEDYP